MSFRNNSYENMKNAFIWHCLKVSSAEKITTVPVQNGNERSFERDGTL